MFLPELVLSVLCLTMFCVDIYLGMVVYEKYLTLPKLRLERKQYLDRAYRAVKELPAKRRKAVNDAIRRKALKRMVKVGNKILHFPLHKKERKVA